MDRPVRNEARRPADVAPGDSSGEGGFTVIEAAVSMTVLAVALLSLFSTIVYCTRSNLAAAQKDQALMAAEARIEELKAEPFDSLVARFGAAGTVGPQFAVDRIDDGDGARGFVVFGLDETSVFGGPAMDLNGDGDATDGDVTASYEMLPVRVIIVWDGPLGEQQLELRTILLPEAGE